MNRRVDNERERGARQELTDVLQFANTRNRIADAARLEIGDRQCHQVTEQPRAEFDVDAVRGVREQIDAQRAENSLEHSQRDEAHNQNVERAHASMHEHLVDHDLEEQRRDESEDLEEERRGQHFAKQSAIFVDSTDEPADVKSPGEIRQGRTPGHQDDVTVPDGLEFGLR
ncbi:uncharacterized protein with von Willebrand factor type A (vWA) domain [Bradyrhizobium japonicum]